jgi:hypothetical protein
MKRSEKIEKFFTEEIKMNHIDIMYYVDAESVNSLNYEYESIYEQNGFDV